MTDLQQIYDFLAAQTASSATIERQLLLIPAAVETLAVFPARGRKGRVKSTREFIIPDTPYRVDYVDRKTHIEILAVIHGARRWPGSF